MIQARALRRGRAGSADFDWYAGVPCSYLTPFINYVLQDSSLRYVSMANEGDAVALIAGVTLGATGLPPARHLDDAELGAGQCGESPDVAHLDLPPAAAV